MTCLDPSLFIPWGTQGHRKAQDFSGLSLRAQGFREAWMVGSGVMRGLEEEEGGSRRNRGHLSWRPVRLEPREGGWWEEGQRLNPSRAWEALERSLVYFPQGTCRRWSPITGE